MRLQASSQAQSRKFLSAAIRNIMDRAYPGINNRRACSKYTNLQQAGKKYLLLAKKELVLAPLQGTLTKSVCHSQRVYMS